MTSPARQIPFYRKGHRTVKHSFPDLEPLAYFHEVLARFSER
jgi:hypothetical protein